MKWFPISCGMAVLLAGCGQAENPQAASKAAEAEKHYSKGVALRLAGDFKGATAELTRAIELDPKAALAWNERGFARYQDGDREGALSDYNKAITLAPKMALAWQNRGLVKSDMGDLPGAVADLTEAIKQDPQNGTLF